MAPMGNPTEGRRPRLRLIKTYHLICLQRAGHYSGRPQPGLRSVHGLKPPGPPGPPSLPERPERPELEADVLIWTEVRY